MLAHAPEPLHEEITADYSDMIYATTCEEIEARHKAFIRKWRLKYRAVFTSVLQSLPLATCEMQVGVLQYPIIPFRFLSPKCYAEQQQGAANSQGNLVRPRDGYEELPLLAARSCFLERTV